MSDKIDSGEILKSLEKYDLDISNFLPEHKGAKFGK